jgi:hypothetical protein
VTGLEPLVIGYLTAWAAQKARRIAGRADGMVDQVLDATMDRLDSAVLGKVGDHPAIVRFEWEAAHGTVNEMTTRHAEEAIGVAVGRDEVFAAELRALVDEIRAAATTQPPQRVVVHATASGQAKMPVLGSGNQNNSFA